MTYSDIRDEILLTLRVPTDMVGDTRSLVDLKMKRVVDFLVRKYKPAELLKTAGPFAVTSATTSVSISTDLSVDTDTDLGWIHAVALDKDQSGDGTPKAQRKVDYAGWIQLDSECAGNQRPEDSYTVDDSYNIILRRWPQTSQNWDLYLYYFEQTAAISDSGEPPLPPYHHDAVVAGVVVEFPHFFQGNRESVLRYYNSMYEKKQSLLLRSRMNDPSALTFRGAKSIRTSKRNSNVFPESV